MTSNKRKYKRGHVSTSVSYENLEMGRNRRTVILTAKHFHPHFRALFEENSNSSSIIHVGTKSFGTFAHNPLESSHGAHNPEIDDSLNTVNITSPALTPKTSTVSLSTVSTRLNCKHCEAHEIYLLVQCWHTKYTSYAKVITNKSEIRLSDMMSLIRNFSFCYFISPT